MKKHGLYVFASIIAICAVMQWFSAQAKDMQQVTPVISIGENSAFEYSARKFLGYVSEAHAALDNKDKEDALNDLDTASRALAEVRNIRNYLEMTGIAFGRVFYGEGSSYYIPVADDTYAVRTYKQGPFWSTSKGTAVRNVQIVTVNIAIDPEKAMAHVRNAQKEIADNNYRKAKQELGKLLDESIHEVAATEEPFTRLEDNIYLTRVLLRQNNYSGARYALRNAKSALDDYAKTLSMPDDRVNEMRQEIDALNATIQDRDPTALKKATDSVEKWWQNLKAWTRKNT